MRLRAVKAPPLRRMYTASARNDSDRIARVNPRDRIVFQPLTVVMILCSVRNSVSAVGNGQKQSNIPWVSCNAIIARVVVEIPTLAPVVC
jgi:hypothetical protein